MTPTGSTPVLREPFALWPAQGARRGPGWSGGRIPELFLHEPLRVFLWVAPPRGACQLAPRDIRVTELPDPALPARQSRLVGVRLARCDLCDPVAFMIYGPRCKQVAAQRVLRSLPEASTGGKPW